MKGASTVPCKYCGHYFDVSVVLKVSKTDGGFEYICNGCAVRTPSREGVAGTNVGDTH